MEKAYWMIFWKIGLDPLLIPQLSEIKTHRDRRHSLVLLCQPANMSKKIGFKISVYIYKSLA